MKGTGPEGDVIFHSKVVIDASGFNSTVCKAMGLVTQWKKVWSWCRIRGKS